MWRTWLAEHRDDVSVVAYDGTRWLKHNAEVPRVLASTVKVVHLLAYATAVTEGRLDPAELVRVGDWDAWHPFDGDGPIGAGAHHTALTELGIPCDSYGIARDPEQRIPLEAIVRAMIVHSDNAAPDYLRARLGDAALSRGLEIRWFCGETLRSLFPGRDDELAARFTRDPAFRGEVLERVRGDPITAEAEWAWTQRTAHGTATDLFALHRMIATAPTRPAELARRILRGPGDVLFKGGSLMRSLGFGMSTPTGTVAMLLTGTGFPPVSLFDLGDDLLRDLPAYGGALGVRDVAG